jgi:phosphomevalonate kinase
MIKLILIFLFPFTALAQDTLTINQIDEKIAEYQVEIQARKAAVEKAIEIKECLIEKNLLDSQYQQMKAEQNKYRIAMDNLETLYDKNRITDWEYRTTIQALQAQLRQYTELEKTRYEAIKQENKSQCPER